MLHGGWSPAEADPLVPVLRPGGQHADSGGHPFHFIPLHLAAMGQARSSGHWLGDVALGCTGWGLGSSGVDAEGVVAEEFSMLEQINKAWVGGYGKDYITISAINAVTQPHGAEVGHQLSELPNIRG